MFGLMPALMMSIQIMTGAHSYVTYMYVYIKQSFFHVHVDSIMSF